LILIATAAKSSIGAKIIAGTSPTISPRTCADAQIGQDGAGSADCALNAELFQPASISI
jgi:hypothetical protein